MPWKRQTTPFDGEHLLSVWLTMKKVVSIPSKSYYECLVLQQVFSSSGCTWNGVPIKMNHHLVQAVLLEKS